MPLPRSVPRRQPVLAVPPGGHGVFQPHIPQRQRHAGRHTAVEGIHTVQPHIEQRSIHQRRAAAAALLHAGAPQRHDLVCARRAGIHPLHAVLLKKDHAAQTRRRASKHAVGASGRRIAVGAQARKAVPVPEIPQLAGVDLVHRLSVDDAVLAAPQAVALLHHEIHVRDGALHRHCRRLAAHRPAHPRHRDPVLVRCLQGIESVYPLRLAAPHGHAVPGGEAPSDTGGRHLGAYVLHLQPRAAVIALEHRLAVRRVHP